MNLNLDIRQASNYTSNSQIARVLTEAWVKANGYCPDCGTNDLIEFDNNRPVADFYCERCSEQFELKSKSGIQLGNKIVDGAYSTMIRRINSEKNPSFFFLSYDKSHWQVRNFLIIPKHFFVTDIVEKRKALGPNARRAGWVGCNINLNSIPESGRIFMVRNSRVIPKEMVQSKWKETEFLKTKRGNARGWILDVMCCVDALNKTIFSLKDMYSFEERLQEKYPDNRFIKDKIRQQLQLMRDKGLIEFVGRGLYKKIS